MLPALASGTQENGKVAFWGARGTIRHPERSEGSRWHSASCALAAEILRCAQTDATLDSAILLVRHGLS